MTRLSLATATTSGVHGGLRLRHHRTLPVNVNQLSEDFRRRHGLGPYATVERALDSLVERGVVEREARDRVMVPDVFLAHRSARHTDNASKHDRPRSSLRVSNTHNAGVTGCWRQCSPARRPPMRR